MAGIGQNGQIFQPTAILCSDRDAHYTALDRADDDNDDDDDDDDDGDDDDGDDDGLLAWCRYVLRGLKREIEKIDRLSDYVFLRDHLLLPSVSEFAERGGINNRGRSILLAVARSGKPIANSDARAFFDEKVSVTHKSRLIAGLRERNLLVPIAEGTRTYTLDFSKSPLLRTLIRALDKEGFLPF